MNGWIKLVIGVALAASTLTVLVLGGRRFVDQRRTTAEITRLRDDLYRARISADRCRNALTGSEAALRTLTRTVDSLRSRVDSFEALGGTLLASGTYAPAERDYSAPIRALLALDDSEERHRALTNTLGVRTQFQPRRRDDLDLVFIAARPEQARLLGPQLRFHRTGELPIYATAAIYDGDTPGADLAGLRFCDMPWMVTPDGDAAALRGQLRALFPSRPKEHARLLALGHDAYTLVQLIERGQLQQGTFFPAVSGTLTLRNDGVIARRSTGFLRLPSWSMPVSPTLTPWAVPAWSTSRPRTPATGGP